MTDRWSALLARAVIAAGASVAIVAALAALFPAAAQRPLTNAERAALQRELLGLDTVAPAAGGDASDPDDPSLARPHVLLLSIRPQMENLSAGKAPVPSADQLARAGAGLFMQGVFPERKMQEFDDWWACAAIADWWRADGDPRITRVACRPKGTLRAERGAAPGARR